MADQPRADHPRADHSCIFGAPVKTVPSGETDATEPVDMSRRTGVFFHAT